MVGARLGPSQAANQRRDAKKRKLDSSFDLAMKDKKSEPLIARRAQRARAASIPLDNYV